MHRARKYAFLFSVFLCLSLIGLSVFAESLVSVVPQLTPPLPADGEFSLTLRCTISEGWHINGHRPAQDFLIPTEVTLELPPELSLVSVSYPEPEAIRFAFFDEAVLVYSGTIVIEVKLRGKSVTGSDIKGTLTYQGCNDRTCVQPDDVSFSLTVSGLASTADVQVPSEGPVSLDEQPAGPPADAKPSPVDDPAELTGDELTAMSYISSGFFYALLMFFLAGLSLNLTPCVYPVIPITVSYFGSQSEEQRGNKFLIALSYTIGIALVFAVLGLLSSLAGKQWGFLFQNIWFSVVLAMIMLIMAASMFGVFEIRIPSSLMSKLGQSRQGILGALIMGLTVGVVIAPCAAGIIIGLVSLVARQGLVVQGTVYFFVMGFGLGLPYLILAGFSGLLGKIPMSGMWMIWIKKLFGLILVGVALYFLLPLAQLLIDQRSFYFGVLAMFGGVYLGFLDRSPGYTKNFNIVRIIVGIVCIIAGIVLINAAIQAGQTGALGHDEPIDWVHYSQQTDQQLLAAGKPVIMDFYADWCAPCRAMDATTFRDPAVVEKSLLFTMVRVDCTRPNEAILAFMERHRAKGMPTIVFLGTDGKERTDLRSGEFLDARQMLERMAAMQ